MTGSKVKGQGHLRGEMRQQMGLFSPRPLVAISNVTAEPTRQQPLFRSFAAGISVDLRRFRVSITHFQPCYSIEMSKLTVSKSCLRNVNIQCQNSLSKKVTSNCNKLLLSLSNV